MTNKKFICRKKEHIVDIIYNRRTREFARSNLEECIQINFNKSKIIRLSNSYYPFIIMETIKTIICKNRVNYDTYFNLPKLSIQLLQDYNLRYEHQIRNNNVENPEMVLQNNT